MSIWGTGLYQNDVADDIKYDYHSLLQRGESDNAALEYMLSSYSEVINDTDDGPLFWLAFADVQWKLGRLDATVKQKALTYIEQELNSDYLPLGKLSKARENTLKELQKRLLSVQPERKKVSIVHEYRCEWRDNDIYALKLTSDLSKEQGLFGKYVLIQKVGDFLWKRFPHHLNPIIRLKISDSNEIPLNLDEFDRLEYIKVWSRPYELRFIPSNGLLSQEEEKAECDALRCEVDETGNLPEYKAALYITSKRSLPKNLFYVGNFGETKPPRIEFIPRGGAGSLDSILAKNLEKEVLDRYRLYMN